MTDSLNVLCIEDSEDDVILLRRHLKRGNLEAVVTQVTNEEELRRALSTQEWDVVICDYLMPDLNAETALRIVKETDADLPLIILSGTISDEAAVSMMKAGAQDYILKDNLSRLVPAIRREINEANIRREKRKAENALMDSEMRHRLILESMTDTVFVLDSDGYITEYYSKKSLIPGVKPEEMVGRRIGDMFDSGTSAVFMSLLPKVIALQQTILFDYITHISGIRKWHSANLTPHENKQHIVVIIRDISDMKMVEEQLRASNHMANLYLDIMSHDIRNYLQAIMISAELLYDVQESAAGTHFVDQIVSSVGKCEQLISGITVTAELPVIPLEKTNLVAIIKKSIEQFRAKNDGIIISTEFQTDSAIVMADRFIEHVISSLLDNAREHGEGKVTDIWVKLQRKRRGYEIVIADNGPGILDKKKREIFDAERRFGGIGLHQVKQIVTKYGGKIEVTDRIPKDPSQGAAFLIWLPQADSD